MITSGGSGTPYDNLFTLVDLESIVEEVQEFRMLQKRSLHRMVFDPSGQTFIMGG